MAITASNGNLRIEALKFRARFFSQLEEEKARKRKGRRKQKDMISDIDLLQGVFSFLGTFRWH